jgi:hypothetical protein
MAEKNSLWKNIRKKAEQNRRTGAKPKKPTAEMLRQEAKIKAKKAEGGYMYPDGGKIKVYTDPKEFRKAEQAYNDSLSLYKKGEELMNEDDPTYGGIYQFVRVNNPNEYYYQATSDIFETPLKPESFYVVNSGSDVFFPRWKKPSLKPVLEERNLRPNIDNLQSKRYTSDSDNMSIINNTQSMPTTNSIPYEGTYEKYKRSPYEDYMYRVHLPNQKMDIVSEDKFKELNENYYLQNLEEKSKGGYMYAEGGGDDDKPFSGKQKAVASTTDVSVRALPEGLFEHIKANPIPRQPQIINLVDNRKYNPVTKGPINPNRDLVSGQFEDTIVNEIINSAYKHGVDPYTALAIGLQESRWGKTDSNIGHVMTQGGEDYIPGVDDMVMTIKDKEKYARKLGYKDKDAIIQAYNGLGVLSSKRGEIGKSAYGVPIPEEGIDLSKPGYHYYGYTINDIAKNVLQKNPDVVSRVEKVFKPKMDGGYMYYAGGPMQYKRGGLLKDIGLGVADFALSTIGGVTGIQSMKDIVNEKQYSNDKFDAGANFAGKLGSTALKLIPVTAPIANAAGIVGGAANKAFGIDAANYNPNQEVSDLEKAGDIVGQVGNVASMFMGNTSGAASAANTGKFMQGVNKINQFGQSPAGQLLNQGLSFEQGGDINNNSLNLQNSMRNRYNSYRKKSKGGTFHQYGINQIPDSAGLHHQNAYGGVPIGPDAMAEGGEYVLDGNYVVSDRVDGMDTQTDEFGNTMAENLEKALNKYTLRDLDSKNKDKPRRPNDFISKETIEQIKQQAIIETEESRAEAQAQKEQNQAMREAAVQYAAAGGKLNKDITKIVEEEYAAAYGGYINPKKYKGLNMPYSGGGKLPKEVLRARVESHMSPEQADAYVEQYAKGGSIHIKESKKGTFTKAAKKRGKSVQEFARQVLANKDKYSAAMVKKANFARNAAKWKHAEGGPMDPPDKYFRKSDSTSYANRGLRNDIMDVLTKGIYDDIAAVETSRKFGYNPSYQEIDDYYKNYGVTERGKFEKARVEGEAGALKDYQNNKYMSLTNQDVIDLAEKVIDNDGSYMFDNSSSYWENKVDVTKNLNKLDLDRVKSMVAHKLKNKSTGGYYAQGGPVVSNVNQDFDLYAQNRGGMMMADGGMMPQDDGMSKQVAAALQQGADPKQLLQQLIESGMDPQQAQAMLQAIMGSMQASQTQAPMMAMGGKKMYSNGGGDDEIPQYAGQLGKESWLTTAAGLGQTIPDIAAGVMAARALKKKDYEVKPFTVEGPKFNVEPIAIGMKDQTSTNKALMAQNLRNAGMTAAGLRGSLAGYYGQESKGLAKGLTDLYTQKYNVEGQGQFQADMFNAKAKADALTATMQGKEGYMQDILNAGQGVTNKLANYYANRQKAGVQQWQAENTKSPYYSYITVDGQTKKVFQDQDGNYRDDFGNIIETGE